MLTNITPWNALDQLVDRIFVIDPLFLFLGFIGFIVLSLCVFLWTRPSGWTGVPSNWKETSVLDSAVGVGIGFYAINRISKLSNEVKELREQNRDLKSK